MSDTITFTILLITNHANDGLVKSWNRHRIEQKFSSIVVGTGRSRVYIRVARFGIKVAYAHLMHFVYEFTIYPHDFCRCSDSNRSVGHKCLPH